MTPARVQRQDPALAAAAATTCETCKMNVRFLRGDVRLDAWESPVASCSSAAASICKTWKVKVMCLGGDICSDAWKRSSTTCSSCGNHMRKLTVKISVEGSRCLDAWESPRARSMACISCDTHMINTERECEAFSRKQFVDTWKSPKASSTTCTRCGNHMRHMEREYDLLKGRRLS